MSELVVLRRADGSGVAFDCSVEETHSRRSTVTKFPVETGAKITDHIRTDPDTLALTGIIGAHPLAIDVGYPDSEDRVQRAFNEILAMQAGGEVLDVLTTLTRYSSMVISSSTVPRLSTTGCILRVSLTLEQIVTVSSQSVTLPVQSTPRGKTSKTGGRKTGETVSTPATAEQEAWVNNAANGFFKFTGGDALAAAAQNVARR